MTKNDQNRQNNNKPYLTVSRFLNSLQRFGDNPKYGRENSRFEVILGQSGRTIFLRQAFGKIVMSNKGAGQGQNGVLSHRDDTEWKMTDSNKRIRFYFSVARIFEKGHFNTI